MVKTAGYYKSYRYFKEGSLLKIYTSEYQRDKLKSLKGLNFPMHTVHVYEPACCIQVQPWLMFSGCTNLKTVEFPPRAVIDLIPSTTDSIKDKIDVIDLLLNTEGFYK